MTSSIQDCFHCLTRLDKKFGPIYLVGGAIRDALLKDRRRFPEELFHAKDFDFIVKASAKNLAQQFTRQTKGRLIQLDEERRIYRVIVPSHQKKINFDFANFKGKDINDDLVNRDLTINAMALPVAGAAPSAQRASGAPRVPALRAGAPKVPKSPTSAGRLKSDFLIDPRQGRHDLQNKIIRAVSEKSLNNDPVRLLRAFRFAAEFGFKIEPQTLKWIRKNVKAIKKSAGERIHGELMSLMLAPRAAGILKLMDEVRMLTAIFPELERARNLAKVYYKQGGVLGHVLESVACFETNLAQLPKKLPGMAQNLSAYFNEPLASGIARYATLKLAALVHDIAKPHTAKKIKGRLRFFGHDEKGAAIFKKRGKKLRFAGAEIDLIAKIIRAHLRPGSLAQQPEVTDRAIFRFFRDLGHDGIGVLTVALADHQSYMPVKKRWAILKEPSVRVIIHLLKRYFSDKKRAVPPRLLNGHDIMRALKIPPGRLVGDILEEIHALQAEGKIKNRAMALEAVKKFAKK